MLAVAHFNWVSGGVFSLMLLMLTLCLLGNFACFFVICWFFKINFLENPFRITIRVSNSLDPDEAWRLSGLIWVQTVCKGYQQTALVGKELLIYMYVTEVNNTVFVTRLEEMCKPLYRRQSKTTMRVDPCRSKKLQKLGFWCQISYSKTYVKWPLSKRPQIGFQSQKDSKD